MFQQQSIFLFEAIPEGTRTLKALLDAEASAGPSLTLFEALDAIDQAMDVCEYLAADKEKSQGDAEPVIQWDPTDLLRTENILMFPVPRETAERRVNRFTVKCLPQKLGGIRPTPESRYIELIGELIADCVCGCTLMELKEALRGQTLPIRAPLLRVENSLPFGPLHAFLCRFFLDFGPHPSLYNLHLEWQSGVVSPRNDDRSMQSNTHAPTRSFQVKMIELKRSKDHAWQGTNREERIPSELNELDAEPSQELEEEEDLVLRDTVSGTFSQFATTMELLNRLIVRNASNGDEFISLIVEQLRGLNFAPIAATSFDPLMKEFLYGIQKHVEWLGMVLDWRNRGIEDETFPEKRRADRNLEFFYRSCLQSMRLIDKLASVAGVEVALTSRQTALQHLIPDSLLKVAVLAASRTTALIPQDLLTYNVLIGGGAEGFVTRCSLFDSSTLVAVKESHALAEERVAREGAILSRLHHPSICHFFGFRVLNDGRLDGIVLELLQTPNSLQDMLSKPELSFPKRMTYAYQLTQALCYMHCVQVDMDPSSPRSSVLGGIEHRVGYLHRGVVHGDLKAANVGLTPDGKTAKWIDFGCARTLEQAALAGPSGEGQWLWQEPSNGLLSTPEQREVYSLGVTFSEFLNGTPVTDPPEGAKVMTAGQKSTVPVDLKELITKDWLIPLDTMKSFRSLDDFKDLIMHCLNPDPAKRATLKEVYTQIRAIATASWLELRDFTLNALSENDTNVEGMNRQLEECNEHLARFNKSRPTFSAGLGTTARKVKPIVDPRIPPAASTTVKTLPATSASTVNPPSNASNKATSLSSPTSPSVIHRRLPPDLMLAIFLLVCEFEDEVRPLTILSRVCREWNRLCAEPFLWNQMAQRFFISFPLIQQLAEHRARTHDYYHGRSLSRSVTPQPKQLPRRVGERTLKGSARVVPMEVTTALGVGAEGTELFNGPVTRVQLGSSPGTATNQLPHTLASFDGPGLLTFYSKASQESEPPG